MQRHIRFGDKSRLERTRLPAYYIQRLIISRRLRRIAGVIIRYALVYTRTTKISVRCYTTMTKEFRENGLLRFWRILNQKQCNDILEYLVKKPFVTRQRPNESFNLYNRPNDVKLEITTLKP